MEQGHKVTVLNTNVDGAGQLNVPLDRSVEMDWVQVHYCSVASPRRIYYSPMLARLADRMVPGVDVAHGNWMFLWPGPYVARVARRAGVPLVILPVGC